MLEAEAELVELPRATSGLREDRVQERSQAVGLGWGRKLRSWWEILRLLVPDMHTVRSDGGP